MRITTNSGFLDPLKPEQAKELFNVLDVSRQQMHPWLPWLRRIHSPEDMESFIGELLLERGPQFVIKINDNCCGGVGFYDMDAYRRKASLGYWLGAEYTGRGIMCNAVKSLCHHGFNDLGLSKIEIRCATQNDRSRSVPERLGFFLEGIVAEAEWLLDDCVDHACYSLMKTEFNIAYLDEISQEIAPESTGSIWPVIKGRQ